MQDSNFLLAQEAYRIEGRHRQTLAEHRLRGISTLLFLIYQEGAPQCAAVAVPYEAQMLLQISHEVLELTLRQIDDNLARQWNDRAREALAALNEACLSVVLMAIERRRECGFRVLEPNIKWLAAAPRLH